MIRLYLRLQKRSHRLMCPARPESEGKLEIKIIGGKAEAKKP